MGGYECRGGALSAACLDRIAIRGFHDEIYLFKGRLKKALETTLAALQAKRFERLTWERAMAMTDRAAPIRLAGGIGRTTRLRFFSSKRVSPKIMVVARSTCVRGLWPMCLRGRFAVLTGLFC